MVSERSPVAPSLGRCGSVTWLLGRLPKRDMRALRFIAVGRVVQDVLRGFQFVETVSPGDERGGGGLVSGLRDTSLSGRKESGVLSSEKNAGC